MGLTDVAAGDAPLLCAAWRKSSYSNPSGNCVEFARLPGRRVAVRDSRYPGGAVLVFAGTEWETFLALIRNFGTG